MSRVETGLALRQALASAERAGVGRAYPRALRSRTAEYVHRRRSEGVGDEQIARELGISAVTCRRWAGARTGSFAEARVVETPTAGSVVVHGPRGLRVEGLALEQVIELWVGLS
jgi:transposase